jgi:hypothetical protein
MDDYSRSEVAALLDQLDELIHNAKPIPLTMQVRIDRTQFYDVLDKLRATLRLAPDEGQTPAHD